MDFGLNARIAAKANANAWAQKHPERVLARVMLWTEQNRERFEKNQAEYNKNNVERRRITAKAWRDSNYARHRETVDAWQSRNKGKVSEIKRACTHRRRAWKLGGGGTHTNQEIASLHEKQRGKCASCTISIKRGYHVDHIQPLSKGGSNWIWNIQLLCRSCNCRKSAMHPIDFMQSRGMLL